MPKKKLWKAVKPEESNGWWDIKYKDSYVHIVVYTPEKMAKIIAKLLNEHEIKIDE